jgi:hypothetical protein
VSLTDHNKRLSTDNKIENMIEEPLLKKAESQFVPRVIKPKISSPIVIEQLDSSGKNVDRELIIMTDESKDLSQFSPMAKPKHSNVLLSSSNEKMSIPSKKHHQIS